MSLSWFLPGIITQLWAKMCVLYIFPKQLKKIFVANLCMVSDKITYLYGNCFRFFRIIYLCEKIFFLYFLDFFYLGVNNTQKLWMKILHSSFFLFCRNSFFFHAPQSRLVLWRLWVYVFVCVFTFYTLSLCMPYFWNV